MVFPAVPGVGVSGGINTQKSSGSLTEKEKLQRTQLQPHPSARLPQDATQDSHTLPSGLTATELLPVPTAKDSVSYLFTEFYKSRDEMLKQVTLE